MVDAVLRTRGALSGNNPPTPGVSATGRNLLFSNLTSFVDFGSGPATANMALSGCTFFFWCKPTGVGGLAERNDGNSLNAGWEVGINASLQLAFLKEFSTSNMSMRSTSTVPTNQYISLAITYDGTGTNSGVGFYINGVTDTAVLNGTGSGTSGSDVARSLSLGTNSFSGGVTASAFGGNIEFAAFFKRVLSPAEIMSMHRNRYQILAAPSRRFRLTLAAQSQAGRRPQIFICT
jgi:hypothetical protein